MLNSCINHVQAQLAQPCLLCGARSRAGLICPACTAELPGLPEAGCPVCAQPGTGGLACGRCLRRPPAYAATVARYRYAFPADVLVQRLKYNGQTVLAAWLADRLAEALAGRELPDLIVPMPLHPGRLGQRGYNQAVLLAARLSRRLGVEMAPAACRRVRDTPPQVELALKDRRRNIRGAFACDAVLTGRRVALVDDVMTSGASLDELARTVRRAGAAEVTAWVVARALPG